MKRPRIMHPKHFTEEEFKWFEKIFRESGNEAFIFLRKNYNMSVNQANAFLRDMLSMLNAR